MEPEPEQAGYRDRVLLSELDKATSRTTIEDTMRKYGVIRTDLRLHGTMAADEFEQFIVTIIGSLPSTADEH